MTLQETDSAVFRETFIPQVREIGVLSVTGDWMYSSFETIPTVNNSDREYFR